MKIALCNLPAWNLHYPAGAPAILKSVVHTTNNEARTFDFAYDLFNAIADRSMSRYDELQSDLVTPGQWSREVTDDSYMVLGDINETNQNAINLWVDHCVTQLEVYQPDVVGLSVFSYWSHKSTILFCRAIRNRMPDVHILLGGRGTSSTLFGPDRLAHHQAVQHLYPDTNEDTYFSEWIIKAGLADTVLQGDVEQSFKEWITGGAQPVQFVSDINKIVMNDIPPSNFDDYDLAGYPYYNGRALPISGSKGCVRACTFCDVATLWPKFLYKDGTHVADEMASLVTRYQAQEFYITDSLANGSMIAFMDFLRKVVDYKEQGLIPHAMTWTGHYITRPIHQNPTGMYELMGRSGAQGLAIGVESGSDRVRDQMKKKFHNADLDHEMQQFSQNHVTAVLLFFCGYPTETWDDFLETIYMLQRYQCYGADGTLAKVALGTPYSYLHDTPMDDILGEYQMEIGDFGDLWRTDLNPDLHYLERIRRRLIMQEACSVLNAPVSRNYYELLFMYNTLKSKKNAIKDFFSVHDYKFQFHPNVTGIAEFGDTMLMPVELQKELISNYGYANLELDITVESDDPNWIPTLHIQFGGNKSVHYLTQTNNYIQLEFDEAFNTSDLQITLDNQPVTKTHFWSGGDNNNYSCKQLLIERMTLNGINMRGYNNHLEKQFSMNFGLSAGQLAHVEQHGCNTNPDHKWRMWTNSTLSARFEHSILRTINGWNNELQADTNPSWEFMATLKSFLLDY